MIATSPQHRRTPPPALLREEVAALAPGLDPGSETFRAGVLLLAGLYLGQNVDRLARYLGESPAFVAKCARRLVDNGVWRAGATVGAWCQGLELDGFWKDVAVAEGRLCRRLGDDGAAEWAPPGEWMKRFSYVASALPEDVCVSYADREHAPPPNDGAADAPPPAAPAAADRLVYRPSWRLGTPRRPRFRHPLPPRPSALQPTLQARDPLLFPDLFPNAIWIG